jgi:hypothetical protein
VKADARRRAADDGTLRALMNSACVRFVIANAFHQLQQGARGQVFLAHLEELDALGKPAPDDLQQGVDTASRPEVGDVVANHGAMGSQYRSPAQPRQRTRPSLTTSR